jgi:hypothetical protein
MQAYEELLKHNHIIHTIDLRIRCSPEELKLISEHVFKGLIVQSLPVVSNAAINLEVYCSETRRVM